jgi:hypothetical protein
MKKIFLLFAFLSAGPLCFAQEVPAPVSQAAQASAATKTVTSTGRVDSVTIGDSSKGIRSQLVIVSDYGKNISLSVSDETSITDKDGKKLAISDVKKDNKVTIVYLVGKKVNRAQSVKLIE